MRGAVVGGRVWQMVLFNASEKVVSTSTVVENIVIVT
jgi:hypothetical protein